MTTSTTEQQTQAPYISDPTQENAYLGTRHGVFYPAGHTVFAFESEQQLDRAWQHLDQQVSATGHAIALRSTQMQGIVQQSRDDATLVANIVAAELKQLDILSQVADNGGVFLIVESDILTDEVTDSLIDNQQPLLGLQYGSLTMQELVGKDMSAIGDNPLGMNERKPGE